MFYNLRLLIVVFYLVTVLGFVALFYYLFFILKLSLFLSGSVVILLGGLSAYLLSRFATQPLLEYIEELQSLSSQTLHELNLPITTIKTNLSMIKKNQSDEKLLRRLERIEEATSMLKQRYDELDYLIKTQSTKQILEEFDIAELLQKRQNFLQNIYPSHTIELQCQKDILKNDPIGLSKALDNLVENAVKYSPKDSKILIKYENFTLSVSDNGEGIDEVELVKIFDRYYQNESKNPGFGIGLFMVKRFCDKNNIELLVQSKKNEGTKVELKFKEKNE